jgi:hypothetical protein
LQPLGEPPGEARLERVVDGLGAVLKLLKAKDVGALIRRPEQGVGGRVGGDRLPGYGVDDWPLRAREPCLVDADVAEQVAPARADVGDFEGSVAATVLSYNLPSSSAITLPESAS